jgi:phosphoribosylglycinamide formyltransferase-1
MGERLRLAMLISGSGTTASTIIMRCQSDRRLRRIEPALVISSRPDAEGVDRIRKTEGLSDKDVIVIDRRSYVDRSEAFGEAIIAACRSRLVDLIGQYGWMVRTPANVVDAYLGMMINQHPGPLDPGWPDFGGKGMYGLRVHCARLLFVRLTGRDFWTEAVAQRVAYAYDRGAVLKRRQVKIWEDDHPYSLRDRVLPVEYEVQIETLEDFAEGRVKELTREVPLVHRGEEALLARAKNTARMLFPKG